MKQLRTIKKFIIEESRHFIKSITNPVIDKLDFKNAKKQYENKKEKHALEYTDLLRFEKAYNAVIELEKQITQEK